MKYEHRLCNFTIDRGLLIEIQENFNKEERENILELLLNTYLYGLVKNWPEENAKCIKQFLDNLDKDKQNIVEEYRLRWIDAFFNCEVHKYLKVHKNT